MRLLAATPLLSEAEVVEHEVKSHWVVTSPRTQRSAIEACKRLVLIDALIVERLRIRRAVH